MDVQSRNDQSMSYNHMSLPDRRDSNLASNVSTPFQNHPGLNQALGPHLTSTVGPRATFQDSYRLSASPPPILPHGDPIGAHSHPGAATRLPLTNFSISQASSSAKRKQDVVNSGLNKRRRETEDLGDDGEGHGAKHWTDDEKTKLFNWLMAAGEDEHWNSLRATKNSCLRECAIEIFGGKKTYQALKGCYERNFNVFKQIYALESYLGNVPVTSPNEADRLREYEKRLQAARKACVDVGNISARNIDHWHRIGWYDLFFQRWNGDPATTRPITHRASISGPSASIAVDDGDIADDGVLDFTEQTPIEPTPSSFNPPSTQNPKDPTTSVPASPSTGGSGQSQSSAGSEQTLVNVNITQGMIATALQLLQAQSSNSKMKLEYLRRREEREEKESRQRREVERLRSEREAAESEHKREAALLKQKADIATGLLANPTVDASIKQAAGDYLKKLFLTRTD